MKLNYKRTVLIGLAFMSIAAFWQIYDSIIPLMLKNTFKMGETVTGAVMAMDNVLAIFLLPLFGSLSDRAETPMGKRMPFVVGGTFLSVIFLIMLPIADRQVNLIFFIVTLFLLLLAMGTYRSPAVALMPDLTPNHLRSKGNAVINLMGAVGGVYALIMIKLLVGKGETPDYIPLFISIAALMIMGVGILFITIKEKKVKLLVRTEIEEYENRTGEKLEVNIEAKKAAGQGLAKIPMEKAVKRSMIFLLVSIFLWFTAYNAVTTAFSRYAGEVWKLEGGGFADCLLVATVAAIISYIPIGNLASSIGRKKTILGGVILMTICYLLAAFMGQYHPVMNVFFGLIGIGWAAINVNSYPMIVEMSKGYDIGKFTGTYYIFSMAAQIFTPVFSGILLEKISYRTLFPYAVVFSLMAFFSMLQVYHGDSKPLKRKSVLENLDVED